MRNYVTKANKDSAPDSITTTKLGANEANSFLTELKTAVSTSGQTLANASGTSEETDQLAKALAVYGAGGAEYCIDTGSVNNYILNPVSPKKAVPALFDGLTLSFKPGNTNTGACTANYNSIGATSITDLSGTVLTGGEISNSVTIRYNLSSDRFELLTTQIPDTSETTKGIIEIATQSETDTGTDDTKAVTPKKLTNWSGLAQGAFSINNFLHLRDEKPSGTNGGQSQAGTWVVRELNTVKTNTISGVSLSSNQLTLPVGTYYIDASAPAFNVGRHKLRLTNVTDGLEVISGTSAWTNDDSNVISCSYVRGVFYVSGSAKVYNFQHQCARTTIDDSGFGKASSMGVEVYTEVMIWKVV